MLRITITLKNDGMKKGFVGGEPEHSELIRELKQRAAKNLHVDEGQIRSLQIVKHSIDARKKPTLLWTNGWKSACTARGRRQKDLF